MAARDLKPNQPSKHIWVHPVLYHLQNKIIWMSRRLRFMSRAAEILEWTEAMQSIYVLLEKDWDWRRGNRAKLRDPLSNPQQISVSATNSIKSALPIAFEAQNNDHEQEKIGPPITKLLADNISGMDMKMDIIDEELLRSGTVESNSAITTCTPVQEGDKHHITDIGVVRSMELAEPLPKKSERTPMLTVQPLETELGAETTKLCTATINEKRNLLRKALIQKLIDQGKDNRWHYKCYANNSERFRVLLLKLGLSDVSLKETKELS